MYLQMELDQNVKFPKVRNNIRLRDIISSKTSLHFAVPISSTVVVINRNKGIER